MYMKSTKFMWISIPSPTPIPPAARPILNVRIE